MRVIFFISLKRYGTRCGRVNSMCMSYIQACASAVHTCGAWKSRKPQRIHAPNVRTEIQRQTYDTPQQACTVSMCSSSSSNSTTQIQKLLFSKLDSVLAKHPTKKGTLSSSSLKRVWLFLSFSGVYSLHSRIPSPIYYYYHTYKYFLTVSFWFSC